MTQYNPYGVFIVLEELGYLLMSLSFVFLAPVFAGGGRLASVIGWVFVAGFRPDVASWWRSRPITGWRGWTASRSRR